MKQKALFREQITIVGSYDLLLKGGIEQTNEANTWAQINTEQKPIGTVCDQKFYNRI